MQSSGREAYFTIGKYSLTKIVWQFTDLELGQYVRLGERSLGDQNATIKQRRLQLKAA
jgi:hypothetical protein